jgi:hypothetical protein
VTHSLASQMRDLWKIRESIAESMTRKGAVYKYDLSAPHHRMYEIVNDLKKRVHAIPEYQSIDIIGYGHLGDGMATELKHTELVSVTLTLKPCLSAGNIHVNVLAPTYTDKFMSVLEPYVYEWIGMVHYLSVRRIAR